MNIVQKITKKKIKFQNGLRTRKLGQTFLSLHDSSTSACYAKIIGPELFFDIQSLTGYYALVRLSATAVHCEPEI